MTHERATKRQKREPVFARVRCSGHIHVIRWTPRGRITLLGHGNARAYLAAQATLVAMGGKATGCASVVFAARSAEMPRSPLKSCGLAARAARDGRRVRRGVVSTLLRERLALAKQRASETCEHNAVVNKGSDSRVAFGGAWIRHEGKTILGAHRWEREQRLVTPTIGVALARARLGPTPTFDVLALHAMNDESAEVTMLDAVRVEGVDLPPGAELYVKAPVRAKLRRAASGWVRC